MDDVRLFAVYDFLKSPKLLLQRQRPESTPRERHINYSKGLICKSAGVSRSNDYVVSVAHSPVRERHKVRAKEPILSDYKEYLHRDRRSAQIETGVDD